MRRRAALLLAVAPLALAACGGGSKSTKTVELSPAAYVRQSAQKTAASASEHLKLTGAVTVSGQSVTVTGSGDFKDHSGSLHLDFSAGGLTGGIDAVLDGTDLYLKSPLFADALPKGKTWLKLDLAKAAKARGVDLSTLASQDPAQTLAQLKSLKNVTKVGDEQAGGVDATHYRGHLVKTATTPGGRYDVWIGKDDGMVHKVSFSSTIAPQQRLDTSVELSDFGKDVTIEVPSAAETVDATNMNIPGLGG